MFSHPQPNATAPGVVRPTVVGQFMTWPAPEVSIESTVGEANAILAEVGADHAVVTSGRRVCGLLCLLDLASLRQGDPVMWAMTHPAAVISPSTATLEVAQLMTDDETCAAIVDSGDSFGILTRDDLLASGVELLRVCSLCGSAHRVVATENGDRPYCLECAELLVARDLESLCRDLEH